MIIMRIMGGLGNQFFQYACGRVLAHVRHTELRLDTSWFASQEKRNYSLDRFRISAPIADKSDIEKVRDLRGNNLWGKVRRRLQLLKPYYKRGHVRERELCFDPRILQVSRNVYLEGYWASPKYFSNIADILRKELTLVEEMDPANTGYVQEIRNSNSVSVHIRRGDYLGDAVKKFRALPLGYYESAINYLVARVGKARFFIFSDGIDWCRENLRLDHEHEFVSNTESSRDYEDLMLMSMCRHHIIANSTFSWWAAWLSDYREKTIVAPKEWFHDAPERSTRDLIPKEWIQLTAKE